MKADYTALDSAILSRMSCFPLTLRQIASAGVWYEVLAQPNVTSRPIAHRLISRRLKVLRKAGKVIGSERKWRLTIPTAPTKETP